MLGGLLGAGLPPGKVVPHSRGQARVPESTTEMQQHRSCKEPPSSWRVQVRPPGIQHLFLAVTRAKH